jgi:hypothetical protein
MTPEEFLNSPDAQEAVFRKKFGESVSTCCRAAAACDEEITTGAAAKSWASETAVFIAGGNIVRTLRYA